jgi:NAD(P)-dependent dehydrogenase (short-subunit alcohol dehydrogenase family)
VVCGDKDAPSESLKQFMAASRSGGHGTIHHRVFDAASRDSTRALVEDSLATHGALDVLVNNVGCQLVLPRVRALWRMPRPSLLSAGAGGVAIVAAVGWRGPDRWRVSCYGFPPGTWTLAGPACPHTHTHTHRLCRDPVRLRARAYCCHRTTAFPLTSWRTACGRR